MANAGMYINKHTISSMGYQCAGVVGHKIVTGSALTPKGFELSKTSVSASDGSDPTLRAKQNSIDLQLYSRFGVFEKLSC